MSNIWLRYLTSENSNDLWNITSGPALTSQPSAKSHLLMRLVSLVVEISTMSTGVHSELVRLSARDATGVVPCDVFSPWPFNPSVSSSSEIPIDATCVCGEYIPADLSKTWANFKFNCKNKGWAGNIQKHQRAQRPCVTTQQEFHIKDMLLPDTSFWIHQVSHVGSANAARIYQITMCTWSLRVCVSTRSLIS